MGEISKLTRDMVEAAMILKQIDGEATQYVKSNKQFKHIYCANFENSVLKGIESKSYLCDLINGNGGELSATTGRAPKFNSIVSSTALAVNTFAPWKKYLVKLCIPTKTQVFSGFKTLEFEHKTEKPESIDGPPPNLDIWLECDNTDSILAIESKFCEIMSAPSKDISVKYNKYASKLKQSSPWIVAFNSFIKHDKGAYKRLDVKQLLCHYFGMTTAGQKKKHLLYLYWRPENENWKDIEPYKQHEDELKEFSELVKDATDVKFYSMTYQDLWEQWAKLDDNDGAIKKHIAALKKRYSVTIYEKSKTKK